MKRKQGFTLIELLVVIAIIAILAAILFPVFAQAREKARQTTCLSNEKQMGLALMQYVQDYDEAFPQMAYYVSGYPYDWEAAVYPYVKNGSGNTTNGTTYYYGIGGMWTCPSFPGGSTEPAIYGMNYQLGSEGTGTYAHDVAGLSIQTATLSEIDAPADKIAILEKGKPADLPGSTTSDYAENLFQPIEYRWTNPLVPDANGNPTQPDTHLELIYDKDCAPTDTTATCGAGYGDSPGNMPRFRHAGMCNSLFVDGHVKAIHAGQMNWFTNIYIKPLYAHLNGGADYD